MRRIFALGIFIALTGHATAQTIEDADKTVTRYLGKIVYWRDNPDKDISGDGDSLSNANDLLEYYLLKMLTDPKTLTAGFKKSQESGLDCASSEDGQLRFYDWNTWTGGTMQYFTDLVQYKTSKGVAVQKIVNTDTATEGDPGCFYEAVYSVKTISGNTLYLATYGVIGSNRDKGEGIIAYTIEKDKLVNISCFKTATKALSQIEYGYDFFLAQDKRPQIHFKADNKILSIPIVNKDGAFTNRALVYVFDGNNFVFDKNAK